MSKIYSEFDSYMFVVTILRVWINHYLSFENKIKIISAISRAKYRPHLQVAYLSEELKSPDAL